MIYVVICTICLICTTFTLVNYNIIEERFKRKENLYKSLNFTLIAILCCSILFETSGY